VRNFYQTAIFFATPTNQPQGAEPHGQYRSMNAINVQELGWPKEAKEYEKIKLYFYLFCCLY